MRLMQVATMEAQALAATVIAALCQEEGPVPEVLYDHAAPRTEPTTTTTTTTTTTAAAAATAERQQPLINNSRLWPKLPQMPQLTRRRLLPPLSSEDDRIRRRGWGLSRWTLRPLDKIRQDETGPL